MYLERVKHETLFASGIVVAGLLASLAVTRLAREMARRISLLDQPNERSSHNRPVPRLGGIGVMVPFLLGGMALATAKGASLQAFVVLLATAAVSMVGLVDDLRPLPVRWRLAAQVGLAVIVVYAVGDAPLGSTWLQAFPATAVRILLVLWIVWLTNLYNFMDGIDGLAGGQAVLAGIAIATAAFASGAGLTGWLALLLAASNLGFLAYNFPPASIFMGDVGSTATGFFFACIPLLPEERHVSLEIVGLALSLFILDATVTLVRRAARGQRLSQAHRDHYYQRPVVLGFTHRTVTLAAWAGMCVVGLCAALYPAATLLGRAGLTAIALIVFLVAAATVVHLENGARLPRSFRRP
jgi:UDP-N-acetylmuramyl pentapeptide phosphotransferase/UDP-N-acetylglucosamine-1-phosphate transferase